MEWIIKKADPGAISRLAEEMNLPELAARFLVQRGLIDPGKVEGFLKPSLKNLPSPMLLPDMEIAVDRLIKALDQKEPITVFGDYDADGLTSTALLYEVLDKLGANVSTYVPHRIEEGYGMNPEAVKDLAESGCRLIVTVDCGVSDHEGVRAANKYGLDVIVTDHHQVPPELPEALAVINPQRPECRFPQRSLAGVGVAFFLAGGLRMALRERGLFTNGGQPELAPLLPLVAIGTIADVAPLTKINRILVAVGLEHLARSVRPGIRALMDAASLQTGKKVTARDVAFRLAPRLNAPGRIDTPMHGLELLLASNSGAANEKASVLETLNQQRRKLQQETYKQAVAMIEEPDRLGRSIMLWREGWQRGVVGLAASKLAEQFGRPAILLAVENGLAVGSGRSIKGFHMYRALKRCRDYMVRFGGHAQAAGLSVEVDRIESLAEAFESVALEEFSGVEPSAFIEIDAEVELRDLTNGLSEWLDLLAPFGEGNPEPILAVRGLEVLSASTVGSSGNHLKLVLRKDGVTLPAMGFGLGKMLPDLGPRISAAFAPFLSTYRGRTTREWRILDAVRERSVV